MGILYQKIYISQLAMYLENNFPMEGKLILIIQGPILCYRDVLYKYSSIKLW